jgi:hypothetical protein
VKTRMRAEVGPLFSVVLISAVTTIKNHGRGIPSTKIASSGMDGKTMCQLCKLCRGLLVRDAAHRELLCRENYPPCFAIRSPLRHPMAIIPCYGNSGRAVTTTFSVKSGSLHFSMSELHTHETD